MVVKICGILLLLGLTLVLRTHGFKCFVCTTGNDGADCDTVENGNESNRFSTDCPSSNEEDFRMSCMTIIKKVDMANTYMRKCVQSNIPINLECNPKEKITTETCQISICSMENCNGEGMYPTPPPTDALNVTRGPFGPEGVPCVPRGPYGPDPSASAPLVGSVWSPSPVAGAAWINPSKILIFWFSTTIFIHLYLQ